MKRFTLLGLCLLLAASFGIAANLADEGMANSVAINTGNQAVTINQAINSGPDTVADNEEATQVAITQVNAATPSNTSMAINAADNEAILNNDTGPEATYNVICPSNAALIAGTGNLWTHLRRTHREVTVKYLAPEYRFLEF